ncbi:MAG: DUF1638 domain-containing protein [Candidatus Aegiribacteria sp.]|nr:DUF1638 domain-containing protein [Candidatus Aegiribacteria sp.]
MGVIGIITCEVLELEFAHLLCADPDLSRITVLEDIRSARLIEMLESKASHRLRRIPHINSYISDHSQHDAELTEALVRVMELALHRKKSILQKGLINAAREMRPHVDALLLGYGLCGGAIENPQKLLDVGIPVFIPMDGDHPVDDCVGLLMGGRDNYYAEQCKIPGTYFMTPGWTYHWKRVFGPDSSSLKSEMAKRLFDRYERSLLIVTPLMPEDEMEQNVKEFNRLFGCRLEKREGTMEILNETWKAAKVFLKNKDRPTSNGKIKENKL